jgi:hypothetical protein
MTLRRKKPNIRLAALKRRTGAVKSGVAFSPLSSPRRRLTGPTEAQIQIAVFGHLDRLGKPGIVAFHPKNGGLHQSTIGLRARNKKAGVLAGVPDVIIAYEGKTYALELKTEKGRVSDDQLDVMNKLRRAGWITWVAYGLDDALIWLKRHNLIEGT